MIIGYVFYSFILLATLFVSYFYIHYAMKTTTIGLYANVIVASVMQLSAYAMAVFGWFIYTFLQHTSHFFIGLQIAIWVFVICEVCLIGIVLYQYKKDEIIRLASNVWSFSKRNYFKLVKRMKSVRNIKKKEEA